MNPGLKTEVYYIMNLFFDFLISAGNIEDAPIYRRGFPTTGCPAGTSMSFTNLGLCFGTPRNSQSFQEQVSSLEHSQSCSSGLDDCIVDSQRSRQFLTPAMLQQVINLFSNNQLTTTTPPPPAPRPTPPANPDPEVETVMSQEEYCSVSQQHTMCSPQAPKLIYFSLIYFPKHD